MNIKVALAEDNNLLADSIKEKLELFDDIEFKFHAANGKNLIQKISADNSVDVLLMDIEMPEMDGVEAASEMSRKFPEIKVIMLTVFDDEEKIFNSIQAGAIGYLLKDETPDKIYEGIKMAMNGGAPMSPIIAAKTLSILKNPSIIKNNNVLPDFALTERETDVLENLSKGYNYNEISEKLFISPFTVRKHIENIYRKLQVKNKMQAVQKAIQYKII